MSSAISASPGVGRTSRLKAVDWLYDEVAGQHEVCDNCFGERDLDKEFFRTSGGGNDALRDRFCTCGSGTGMDPGVEPQSPHDTRIRGFEGTVARTWPDGSLPIRDDSGLSEMQLAKNLIAALEVHTDYETKPDIGPALDVMAEKSAEYPRQNKKMLKLALWLALTPTARKRVQKDAAQD